MNTTALPLIPPKTAPLDRESQDELIHAIRCFFDEIGDSKIEEGKLVERYATADLGELVRARDHAERYRGIFADREDDIKVEQRNSRVVFTLFDPPSLI